MNMSVKRNLIANYLGSGWTALMAFAFVPFYLKFIGAEGYGLVGFFVMLSSVLAVLDGGLAAAATREIATFIDAEPQDKSSMIAQLRTMEALLWGVALVAGLTVVVAAPLIATYWLKVPEGQIEKTISALRWMGGALLIQFPVDFYCGCLNGLQRQIQLNVINVIGSTIRSGGTVLVLWKIAPTIESFFVWQCVASLVTVFVLRHALWHVTGHAEGQKRFAPETLKHISRFAAGVGGINILALLLTQLDKIILSKVLSLELFGYYTLAWTLGTAVYRFIGPIFNAYYPRIIQLVTQNDQETLENVYLKACRIMAVAIVPFSIWLAVFGKQILLIWTQNPVAAAASAPPLTLLALGTMCNGFMHIPYALQLANGWTQLAFWQNIIAVILLAPLTYFLAKYFSLTGAAIPWLILNIGYVIIAAPVMYNKFLNKIKFIWYYQAVILPIITTTIAVTIIYNVLHLANVPFRLGIIGAALIIPFAITVMCTDIRKQVKEGKTK